MAAGNRKFAQAIQVPAIKNPSGVTILDTTLTLNNNRIITSSGNAFVEAAAITANRALISDSNGIPAHSSVTNTELGYVSGVTSAIQTQLGDKLNLAGGTMSGNIAMGGNAITGLSAPSASSDAATKGYVDSVAEGLKPKAAVRVATTANIVIATALNSGDTIDGITLANGDRVLVKDQTAAEDNGIYVVSATPARSTDFDSLSPIDEINGAMVPVQEGTANAGKIFVQTGAVATLGTDPVNFVFFNSSSALVGGDGITISGSNISVDHDGEGLTFVTNQLALELDGSTLSKSATGLKVAALGITNSEVSASAAIAYSKLDLGTSIVNADISASAAIAYSKLNLATSIVNADISASAAIAYSKLNLATSIVNADISASAAIAYSKLSLSSSIVNADISGSAAIAYSKLDLSSSVVNADIAAGAAIARTKLASGSNNHVIINDGSGVLSSEAQLSTSRGGTGVDASAAANGSLLIGTGSGLALATITAGSGISVTNGSGTITIATTASGGDIPDTQFNFVNNQGSAADVTGLLFPTASVRSFTALVSVFRDGSSDLYEAFTLEGINRAASWTMSQTSVGDDSGMVFTINNSGQVQYTSTSNAGSSAEKMRFRAITTAIEV